MRGSFTDIEKLYQRITASEKLNHDFCVAFVYNSAERIRDQIHASECIYPEEQQMIISAFRASAKYVYSFDGENTFANEILNLKKRHKYVLVYSMAQNINGIGRRCMVPLLCDYYNLINIGAGFMECVYGGSKYLMYKMTKNLPGICFPKTHYILKAADINLLLTQSLSGRWLLKPNDESASIGIEIFEPEQYTTAELREKLFEYQKHYPIFCLQEYIDGDEVAVPLFWYQSHYYCPGISEVVFHTDQHYLDYDTVAMGACSYREYTNPVSGALVENSIHIANALGFKAICRIDFCVKDGIGYIEDIGPNPTISEHNGANELFRQRLHALSGCVYQLLLYSSLAQYNLLKPSFNDPPENW